VSGGYRVLAKVTDETGAAAGTAQTGWTTDLAAVFSFARPEPRAHGEFARKTGGEVIAPEQLESLRRAFPEACATDRNMEPTVMARRRCFFSRCFVSSPSGDVTP
jgi:hypothetical protein